MAYFPDLPKGKVSGGPSNENADAAAKFARQGVDYARTNMVKYRQEDVELWDLMTTVHSCLVNGPWPYICLILNIILPGTGTMLMSCLGFPGAWSKTQLTIGIIQMLTAPYIIGWIFSIY